MFVRKAIWSLFQRYVENCMIVWNSHIENASIRRNMLVKLLGSMTLCHPQNFEFHRRALPRDKSQIQLPCSFQVHHGTLAYLHCRLIRQIKSNQTFLPKKQHKIWWPHIRHVICGNNFRHYSNPTAMMTNIYISIEHLLHQLRSSKSLPIWWISNKPFNSFPKLLPD